MGAEQVGNMTADTCAPLIRSTGVPSSVNGMRRTIAAIALNERARVAPRREFSTETTLRSAPRDAFRSHSATSSFGRAYGSGRRRIPFTRLKIAERAPDAERKRDNDGGGEPRIFSQDAQRIARIARAVVERPQAARVRGRLLCAARAHRSRASPIVAPRRESFPVSIRGQPSHTRCGSASRRPLCASSDCAFDNGSDAARDSECPRRRRRHA